MPIIIFFSVGLTEFATFGMLYLILCLRCRLQIILEDCLIKLIYLSLQCCCDSTLCAGHIQVATRPLCLVIMFIFYVHTH